MDPLFRWSRWCVVEIAAALTFEKPLVFKCCKAKRTDGSHVVQVVTGSNAITLMTNAQWIVK